MPNRPSHLAPPSAPQPAAPMPRLRRRRRHLPVWRVVLSDIIVAALIRVIPPASPSATLVFLIVSRSVVLPWSTCPIIVTTGGLLTKSSSLSFISNSSNLVSSIIVSLFNSLPYSETKSSALSKSTLLFTVASIPSVNNFFTNSLEFTPKALASSEIVIPSLYVTTLSSITGPLLISFSLFLYISFFFLASSFLFTFTLLGICWLDCFFCLL